MGPTDRGVLTSVRGVTEAAARGQVLDRWEAGHPLEAGKARVTMPWSLQKGQATLTSQLGLLTSRTVK